MEQLEEGGLRAGGALSATELETVADSLNVLEVHHELLDPLRRALSWGLLGIFGIVEMKGSYQR